MVTLPADSTTAKAIPQWEASTDTKYSLTINGELPTDLFHVPPGSPTGSRIKIRDAVAEKKWEHLRGETMMAWRHKMLRQCILSIRVVSPSPVVNAGDLIASAIRLLARAGVIESPTVSCVQEFHVSYHYGKMLRMECILYNIEGQKENRDGEVEHARTKEPAEV